MKGLQSAFDFYLDASVHVAFAVLALVKVTGLTFNITVNTHLTWFLFFGTITCYNFMKYGVEAEKYILVANRYHKNIQSASFIAFGLALYHFWFLKIDVIIGICCLLAVTGLYTIPVLPHSKKLRNWGVLKIFAVAFVWAGSTVILPVLSTGHIGLWAVCLETLRRFLLVLALMVPFEIRDLAYDQPELKTLPQRYGITRTKIIGGLATLSYFLLIFLRDDVGLVETVSTAIIFTVLGGLMFLTKREQNAYFASFWVEAVPILWWLLLLLSQNLPLVRPVLTFSL